MSVDEQTKRRDPADEKPSRHSTIMRGVVTPALGIIAIAFIVLGVLNATIWQPTRRIIATATTNSQYVVTDPGVLQVVDSKVRIRVAATNNDARVCLALGSPQDVTGWLGDAGYTRLTGLSSWTELSHRRSASNGKTMDNAVGFSDSDLWSQVVCGEGKAALTTSQGTSGKVLLIDADAGSSQGTDSSSDDATTDLKESQATISMDWTRENLPNYAMPFYFVGGLLIVAAILAASVFAIDPMRRRKKLDESKLKKIEETEMSVMEAFAGAMRPLAGEIRSSFKRNPDSRRRHAHGGASRRSRRSNRTVSAAQQSEEPQVPSTPRVIDVGSKNLVAVQQGSADAMHTSAEGHTHANHVTKVSSTLSNTHSASDSAEETAVISPEELQSYFARFTAETTGSIKKLDDDNGSSKQTVDPAKDDQEAADASDVSDISDTTVEAPQHPYEDIEDPAKEQSTTENGGE
ncbi:MAG: hypothetical protein ABF780_01185 [Bifidobacterium aquikefiri]|uniref:GTPase regulator-like protein n=1 Tax=Bifidobacterium aquikefiri TaxID=1653207 RepID=A0A261G953_9BIFI|nr:hypothetical protein [Bifidobacterium aquikefiri]OZG67948.1 GTPase regulator-like protein [Bifidobacterium aquikefiri]